MHSNARCELYMDIVYFVSVITHLFLEGCNSCNIYNKICFLGRGYFKYVNCNAFQICYNVYLLILGSVN
jgi:hypothetical protein